MTIGPRATAAGRDTRAVPAIEASHLSFQPDAADGPPPLRDLSFAIAAGETVRLGGASGSGKSLLLDLIAGHASAHAAPRFSGSLTIAWPEAPRGPDQPTSTLPARDRRVGYLHQEPGDGLLHLDVLSTLRHALAQRARGHPGDGHHANDGRRTSDGRHTSEGPLGAVDPIDAIIDVCRRFGIIDLLDRETSRLSHGERKRVALAALELQDPDVLLLDEPLAGLDPAGIRLVVEDLSWLTRDRTTVIVEHRPHALAHLIERTIDLDTLVVSPTDGRRPTEPYADTAARHVMSGGARSRLEPAILLEDVTLAHGERKLATNIRLELGPGVWGLVGPNGAGKSTLLSAIAGLHPIRTGRIEVAGHELVASRGRRPKRHNLSLRRDVRIAFQEPREAFLADSVVQELRTPITRLTCRSEASAEASVLEGLEQEHLDHLAERNPLHLSGGESRRIQLLDAALGEPRVWLIDEPTHGLDDVARRRVSTTIERFGRSGGCVLVATHEPDLLPDADGWVLFDSDGTIQVTTDLRALDAMGYDTDDSPMPAEVPA